MSKPTTKLSFNKPSGESRLSKNIKAEMAKGELQRFNLDLPKELAIKLKVFAAEEGQTMREVVISALTHLLK